MCVEEGLFLLDKEDEVEKGWVCCGRSVLYNPLSVFLLFIYFSYLFIYLFLNIFSHIN